MRFIVDFLKSLVTPFVSYMWGRNAAKEKIVSATLKTAKKANEIRNKVKFDSKYRDSIRRMFDKR